MSLQVLFLKLFRILNSKMWAKGDIEKDALDDFGKGFEGDEWEKPPPQWGPPNHVTTYFGFSMKHISLALVSLDRQSS